MYIKSSIEVNPELLKKWPRTCYSTFKISWCTIIDTYTIELVGQLKELLYNNYTKAGLLQFYSMSSPAIGGFKVVNRVWNENVLCGFKIGTLLLKMGHFIPLIKGQHGPLPWPEKHTLSLVSLYTVDFLMTRRESPGGDTK